MKKYIIIVTIVLVSLLILGLCFKSSNKNIYLDSVSMEIYNVTKTSADVKISTKNNEEYIISNDFLIKEKTNGKYTKLKSNCGEAKAFNTSTLSKESSVIDNINWYHCFGSLSSGEYRLEKRIKRTKDNKEYFIKVDFEIN